MSVLDTFIGFFCHQIPERSPHFMGQTFPVCYRCAGLYFGIVSTYLFLSVTGGLRRRLPSNFVSITCAGWILPLLVDGWGNWMGWWSTPGPARALTGLAAGMVLPLFLVPLVQPIEAANRLEKYCRPTICHVWTLVFPVACGSAAIWLLLNPGFAWIFQGLALLSGASLALLSVTFAMAVLSFGPKRSEVEI